MPFWTLFELFKNFSSKSGKQGVLPAPHGRNTRMSRQTPRKQLARGVPGIAWVSNRFDVCGCFSGPNPREPRESAQFLSNFCKCSGIIPKCVNNIEIVCFSFFLLVLSSFSIFQHNFDFTRRSFDFARRTNDFARRTIDFTRRNFGFTR